MVTEKGDFEILQNVWDRANKLTTGEKNNKFYYARTVREGWSGMWQQRNSIYTH